MLALIKLELRKNRLLFIGLTTVSLIAGLTGVAQVILWFPVLITGASCGAQFRAAMKTEEDFPQTPAQRIWAAFWAGLLIAACVLAAGIAGLAVRNGTRPYSMDILPIAESAPLHIPFYACAFLLAFVTGNGVVGGVLGLVQLAIAVIALALFIPWLNHDDSYALYSAIGGGVSILAIVCAGLSYFAAAISRAGVEKSRLWLKTSALVLWPLLLLIGPANTALSTYLETVTPVIRLGEVGMDPGATASAQLHDGILIRSAMKDIYYLRPDGSRKLLLKRSIFHHVEQYSDRYFWTPAGELWLIENFENTKNPVRFYHATKDGPLVFYSSMTVGGYFNFVLKTKEGLSIFKYVPRDNQHGHWVGGAFPVTEKTAWTDFDIRQLSLSSATAHIPGAPAGAHNSHYTEYGALIGGGFGAYIYPLKTEYQKRDKPFSKRTPPQCTIYTMAEDGTVNAPIHMDYISFIVRAIKGKVFFMNNYGFVTVVDTASGKRTAWAQIPHYNDGNGGFENTIPSRDGIFAFQNGKVTFYDWDGKAKQL